ncbi:MAG: tryptophan synthase subunit alpha [Candidatus Ancillula sp.]|jgi:tryptophan synthase alpha chain|nr:tryptophan synthase subunit alpha [Candidatus Ancillula sp.]
MVKKKFIGYLPVSFPDFETSLSAFKVLIDNGVDILEVGVPYSDPVMDGPTIQKASKEAIENGFHIDDLYRLLSEIAQYIQGKKLETQMYVMTYYNMVYRAEQNIFAEKLKENGVIGTIVPDLIPDESGEWVSASVRNGLKNVFLTAPNSTEERLDIVTKNSTGFVYASSLLGTTGAREDKNQFKTVGETIQKVRNSLDRMKKDTPVYLGLGVSNKKQASQISKFADGVIVGSRLIKALDEGGLEELAKVTQDIRSGIK